MYITFRCPNTLCQQVYDYDPSPTGMFTCPYCGKRHNGVELEDAIEQKEKAKCTETEFCKAIVEFNEELIALALMLGDTKTSKRIKWLLEEHRDTVMQASKMRNTDEV